jgi:hypothetical protein
MEGIQHLLGLGNTCLLCGTPNVTETHKCFESKPEAPLPPCPFCGTTQVQFCPDYANTAHSRAKCRVCHATSLASVWRMRSEPKQFPE